MGRSRRKVSLLALLLLGGLGAGAWALQTGSVNLAALIGGETPVPSDTAGKAEAPAAPAPGSRAPAPVETAVAAAAELSDDIAAIGTLLAADSVDIAPETNGRIIAILFEDGQSVEAGQPLIRLDDDLALAELADARARLSLAESNFARSQSLRKTGNIAQSVFDASSTERELARTAVGLAEVRLAKLTVRAPFRGKLGFKEVSLGAYVTAGTTLVHLDRIDRLQVSFSVPELDFARLRVGGRVGLTADALPGEAFEALIVAIDPTIEETGRALKVRASLDNTAERLRPGMLVRLLVRGEPRRSVVVPETALVQRGDGSVVFIVVDGKAKPVAVVTGRRLPGSVEIRQGIAAGDLVITAGGTRLSDGAAVEVVGPKAEQD